MSDVALRLTANVHERQFHKRLTDHGETSPSLRSLLFLCASPAQHLYKGSGLYKLPRPRYKRRR